jgi:hypothetical protein
MVRKSMWTLMLGLGCVAGAMGLFGTPASQAAGREASELRGLTEATSGEAIAYEGTNFAVAQQTYTTYLVRGYNVRIDMRTVDNGREGAGHDYYTIYKVVVTY